MVLTGQFPLLTFGTPQIDKDAEPYRSWLTGIRRKRATKAFPNRVILKDTLGGSREFVETLAAEFGLLIVEVEAEQRSTIKGLVKGVSLMLRHTGKWGCLWFIEVPGVNGDCSVDDRCGAMALSDVTYLLVQSLPVESMVVVHAGRGSAEMLRDVESLCVHIPLREPSATFHC